MSGFGQAESNLLLRGGVSIKGPELPNWASACRKVLLSQTSSATPERFFFSLLENSVRNSQARAMKNYIKASLTFQYNSVK